MLHSRPSARVIEKNNSAPTTDRETVWRRPYSLSSSGLLFHCFLQIRFRWIQLRGAPSLIDKRIFCWMQLTEALMFFPFTFFEYGSRLAQMLGKKCRLTTSCNECPFRSFLPFAFCDFGSAGLSSIYMIRMGLRLVQMLGKKLQADDVMQRMSRFSLFFHLLFANSVQMGSIARSPRPQRRNGPETPAIR